uniref:Uncharacterized protein n=1 Tax=Ralstonia solanacearum TaxID=305 RepID=A0A0S4TUK7_RALSL|nr:protein of unknown function [Ralstonia solanacearum]
MRISLLTLRNNGSRRGVCEGRAEVIGNQNPLSQKALSGMLKHEKKDVYNEMLSSGRGIGLMFYTQIPRG